MCGISGCFEFKQGSSVHSLVGSVLKVAEAQHNRGPDNLLIKSFDFTNTLGAIAHNRLSIIDLTSDANQPFFSHDGRYVICFNGEIYNYLELRSELEHTGVVFRTSSDTEVLLYFLIHYGPEQLDRIEGMFAFSFLDQTTEQCILSRDRFGTKPLVYSSTSQRFAFASDPSALNTLVCSPPNLTYLNTGIHFKYYESDSCITQYSQINYLAPGHFAELDLRSLNLSPPRPYFSLLDKDDFASSYLSSLGFREKCALLRDEVYTSVNYRLRSDVPCGISLSAGVDSNIISSIATSLQPNLLHFVYGDPDQPSSEAFTVRRLRTDISDYICYVNEPKSSEDIQALFWETLRAQGGPFPHTSQLAQFAVFKEARRNSVPVVLGGQGADEAFMGYRKFFMYHTQHLLKRRQIRQLIDFSLLNLSLIPSIVPKANLFWRERKRYFSSKSSVEVTPSLNFFDPSSLSMTSSISPGFGLGHIHASERQYLDIVRYSLPTLLRYEDRNSMASSVESRLPFLSPNVMRLGLRVALSDKLRHGFGKFILRKSFAGQVAKQIIYNRDKRGFDTNHEFMIRNGLGVLIRDVVSRSIGTVLPLVAGGTCSTNDYFSDVNLVFMQGRFAEATSLIWLHKPSGVF